MNVIININFFVIRIKQKHLIIHEILKFKSLIGERIVLRIFFTLIKYIKIVFCKSKINNIKSKALYYIELWSILGIFLITALCLPKGIVPITDGNTRAIGVILLLFMFSASQLLKADKKFKLHSVDIWWVALIIYTGLSSTWAVNSSYSIYGMFTTLLLYICFKSIENYDWYANHTWKSLLYIVFACFLIAISIQFYSIRSIFFGRIFTFDFQGVDKVFLSKFGFNLNHLNGLICMLMPIVVFYDYKHSKIISPLVLIIGLSTTLITGSYRITIVFSLITLTYILLKVKLSQVVKYAIVFVFLATILGSLFSIDIKNENNKEGTTILKKISNNPNTLLGVWDNSIDLFKDSFLVGHGKNNWELLYGKYGIPYYSNNIESKPKYHKHSYNSVLQYATELGFLGMIMLGYIFVLPCIRLINDRQKLSKLEVAAVISVVGFFILSLYFGQTYNTYQNFNRLSILSIASLGILSIKSNRNVTLMSINGKYVYLLFLCALIGCGMYFLNQHKIKMDLGKARIALRKENYKAVTNILERHKENLQSGNIENIYGKALFELNDLTQLESILSKQVQKDPYNVDLRLFYAETLYGLGNYDAALLESQFIEKFDKKSFKNKILNLKLLHKTKLDPKYLRDLQKLNKTINLRLRKSGKNKKDNYSKNSNTKYPLRIIEQDLAKFIQKEINRN